jgi:hypothetical protein
LDGLHRCDGAQERQQLFLSGLGIRRATALVAVHRNLGLNARAQGPRLGGRRPEPGGYACPTKPM